MSNFLENYELNGEKLNIVAYPSPVLAKVAAPVTNFDDELKTIVKNMLFTMYNAPGIGLAAPQINNSLRFFVIDIDYTREEVVDSEGNKTYKLNNFNPQLFINPKITVKNGTIVHEEGCLSLPGYFEEITRAETIILEYQDIDGNQQTKEATELEAICIQHEFDHLEGIVFIDHISLLKKKLIRKKLIKEKKR
jgi:peptide deformylase